MGLFSRKKIILLCFCLVLAGIIVHLKPSQKIIKKNETLKQALTKINGWSRPNDSILSEEILEVLALDDYFNAQFSNGLESIFLYVGYYYTSDKVGSAHDPLVCFPGQGWHLSDKQTGKIKLVSLPNTSISYSLMTGQLGQQKELILYWFQASDTTNSNTFSQKISLLKKRIFRQSEDNAFVRLTIPMGDRPISVYKETIDDFIQNFYPVFIKYIQSN